MRNKLLVFGFLASLIMSGCMVYHPMTTDIPLISEKRDLRIDAGISIIPSAHATISYGLTEKMAIQGFGSIGPDNRYYFQAATGLYKSTGNEKILELYCGFGYGHGENYNDANPGHLYGNYQLYFGQVNFGKIANKSSKFEAGFGLKAGYLHSNLTDNNYYEEFIENERVKIYHDESLLFEPVGLIRIGGNRLKFSVKLGGTIIYKFTHTNRQFPYTYLNLGLGLNYRF